jgi:hypothetical protein
MNVTRYLVRTGGVLALCAGILRAESDVNRPPVIKHEPVRAAAAGQSISIRASVTDDAGAVKDVRLLYSTSRDAAPFKAAMQSTGAGVYVGTLPGSVLSGLDRLSYYIEATDDQDLTSETPWYTVNLQSTATSAVTRTETAPPESGGSSWGRTALYAGGAAALIGAGAWAASGGGGGGGGGSKTNVGTYAGSVTTCLEMEGGSPSCSSHSMSIQVLSDGVVSSDNLYRNQHLEGRLSGSDFALVAEVHETNVTGEIVFQGTVLDSRIVGSVSGSATSSGGTKGVYSGTFSATRAGDSNP